MNNNNRVKLMFEDMAINSEYEILEAGKDDKILKEIAAKRGIVVPSKDLAIFRCKYAMVDQENRNRCTLPRKEVNKALKTIVGKAIDKDHLRQNTIGYWIDSELEQDDIVSYGAFWKSNFPEDYDIIQKKMSEGKMKVSFEAWGDRHFKEDGSYDLVNIEFAGGALLFDTEPAFPDAEVLDMASMRQQVLEFAKVIEEKKEEGKKKICGKCYKKLDVADADKTLCGTCGNEMEDKEEFEKKMKDDVPQKVGKIDSEEKDKTKEGGTKEVDELLKKYSKASAEELIKFIDESVESLTSKEAELATLKAEKDSLTKEIEESKLKLENSKIELEKLQVEASAVKVELDKRIEEEKAAVIKAKRDELGEEFAKELTDEDILNDLKFENAKLKKELALVKQEKGNVTPPDSGLEAGKIVVDKDDSFFKRQESIQKIAFETE